MCIRDRFCYEVRKYIGAYAAALGGLDCLVFTAGVGENGATNRAAICEGLEFLGVKIDPERNNTRGQEALISTDDSKVKVWVIPTNEEPVSYTHLIHDELNHAGVNVAGAGAHGYTGQRGQAHGAVSYTHLDVYKRQSLCF